MRPSLTRILRCPECTAELTCEVAERDTAGVRSGTLRCTGCDRSYPIVGAIPRFVPRENYVASFGEQWNRFRTTQIDRFNGTRLSQARLFRETNRSAESWRGLRVLDVGCGAGRFMDVVARHGGDCVGVDASDAVDAAYANLRGEPSVDVVQADLYRLPFARGAFDLAYCIGVIQHTPDPLRAVAAVPPMVRSGGDVVVNIYERRWATPLFGKYLVRRLLRTKSTAEKLRLIMRWMPYLFPLTDALFRLPTVGRALAHLIPVANYVGIPELGRAQRYEWAVLDTLDMLAPAYDLPQTERDVRAALRSAGVRSIRRLPNVGLNLIGRRADA